MWPNADWHVDIIWLQIKAVFCERLSSECSNGYGIPSVHISSSTQISAIRKGIIVCAATGQEKSSVVSRIQSSFLLKSLSYKHGYVTCQHNKKELSHMAKTMEMKILLKCCYPTLTVKTVSVWTFFLYVEYTHRGVSKCLWWIVVLHDIYVAIMVRN